MSGRQRRQQHVAHRAAAAPPRRVCGDFGGRTQLGEPCQHLAGYNRPHAAGAGPCALHDASAAVALSDAKSQFLLLYGTGKVTLGDAAQHACGIDVRTLLRWRKEDPAFDAAVRTMAEENDAIGVLEVEESWVARLKRGECSAVEVFFYLTNRNRSRWKHINQIELTKDVKDMTIEELQAIAKGTVPPSLA